MEEIFEKIMRSFPHICFRRTWQVEDDVMYMAGECDAIVRAVRYLPLSPDVRQEMLRVSLVKGAMATTAIEGNTLSEAEVRAIQEGRSEIPKSRKYLEQEVKNVLDALNGILEQVVKHHAIVPITSDLIRSFNQQVGRDLGENFESIPGEFRMCEVVVGTYRPPDHRVVKELVARMCEWLKREFGYEKEARPSFLNGIVEAIVAHVYLVWIHPFCDGNGRMARLLEFYLLLRSGIPNTCAHILANHYNNTRSEYYRQLSNAGKTCDLTGFIRYAIAGLRDGLEEILTAAQRYQVASAWRNYLYDRIHAENYSQNVSKRYTKLLAGMDVFTTYSKDQLLVLTPEVAAIYGKVTPGTIVRDLKVLVGHNLVKEVESGGYRANISDLIENLPKVRSFDRT